MSPNYQNQHLYFYYLFITLITVILLFTPLMPAKAQLRNVTDYFKKNISLSGQASVYGELYGIKGADRRRPSSTQRLSITPLLTFSEYFSLSIHVMLSTEESYARQNMNIMGLHPVWQWGRAHLGDYSERFSQYTFNGVNVTGAEVDLYPGLWRFTVGGGQTRRAVQGNIANESYDQFLFASRIGYGDTKKSFIHLLFMKAKDDPGSLTKPDDWEYDQVIPDTMGTELDTIWVEPPYNPYSVTPEENFVAGFISQLNVVDNRIVLKVEGSGSAYTKDLNAEKVQMDSLSIPEWLRKPLSTIFSPRTSSNIDYAVQTNLELNFKNVKTDIGYEFIGPGYISLGTPSTVNDRQKLIVNSSLRLKNHRIRLGWQRMSNNLLKQKEETNIRNQVQAQLHSHTKKWRSQFSIHYLDMSGDAAVDSMGWDYDNIILSTHQAYVFGRESMVRQLGLQYTFQKSNKNMPSQITKSTYHTLNLTGSIKCAEKLNMNVSSGLSFRNTGSQNSYTTQVYSIRLSHTALQNKLSNSLFSSSSLVRDTRMFRVGINSSYRLSRQNQIIFNLSYNSFQGTRNFQELRTSLRLSHVF
ncbi:MAG: hypothetical protein R6V04_05625 [bacterium]